jgi:hypothetical protein
VPHPPSCPRRYESPKAPTGTHDNSHHALYGGVAGVAGDAKPTPGARVARKPLARGSPFWATRGIIEGRQRVSLGAGNIAMHAHGDSKRQQHQH